MITRTIINDTGSDTGGMRLFIVEETDLTVTGQGGSVVFSLDDAKPHC